jgi:two-component system chemotaxis response regulator CheB
MPATFTSVLADHIQKHTKLVCAEAKDGEQVKPGHIYIAPGDYHMLVIEKDGAEVISLVQSPPENYCRPAVDPMVKSLAATYKGSVLTVIFTGMGYDGTKGCQVLYEKGGQILAQDMETSVVWGMPGSVANAGICTDVLPLDRIADKVNNIAMGTK